jgi:hypothetical protein
VKGTFTALLAVKVPFTAPDPSPHGFLREPGSFLILLSSTPTTVETVLPTGFADPAVASQRPTGVRPGTWARAALTCFGAAVLVILALHLVFHATVDPVHQVISDYALFGGAAGFAFGALLLAGGTIALVIGIGRAGIPAPAPFRVLTGIWSAGLTLCAFFRTNLTGSPLSVSGEVHRYAGIALFVGLPSATHVLARHLRRHPSWRPLSDRIRSRTRWGWVALGGFLVSQLPAILPPSPITRDVLAQGLAERVLFVVYLVLLAELAVAVMRAEERKSC